jgi:hypothetical protein
MDDNKLYIVSISTALLIYLFLTFLVIYYISSKNVKLYDIAIKETVIELDMLSVPIKKESKKIIKTVSSKPLTKKPKEIIKKSTSRSAKRTASIKSLFGNVKTNTKQIVKEDILNIRASMANSRFKSKFEKEKKRKNIEESNTLNKIKDRSSKSIYSKTNKENDLYYSDIKKLLHNRFNPKHIKENLSSIVLVTITKNGKFNYIIDQFSDNEMYNQQLIKFLDLQVNEFFPKSPDGNSHTIQIIFTIEK